MALLKSIESDAGHMNSYWKIGEFNLILSKEIITVVMYGYKNKWGREHKDRDKTLSFTFPADKGHKDLKDYEELVLNYTNGNVTTLNTSFKLKVDWKTSVTPDINKIVKNVITDMYKAVKSTEEFKGASDIP